MAKDDEPKISRRRFLGGSAVVAAGAATGGKAPVNPEYAAKKSAMLRATPFSDFKRFRRLYEDGAESFDLELPDPRPIDEDSYTVSLNSFIDAYDVNQTEFRALSTRQFGAISVDQFRAHVSEMDFFTTGIHRLAQNWRIADLRNRELIEETYAESGWPRKVIDQVIHQLGQVADRLSDFNGGDETALIAQLTERTTGIMRGIARHVIDHSDLFSQKDQKDLFNIVRPYTVGQPGLLTELNDKHDEYDQKLKEQERQERKQTLEAEKRAVRNRVKQEGIPCEVVAEGKTTDGKKRFTLRARTAGYRGFEEAPPLTAAHVEKLRKSLYARDGHIDDMPKHQVQADRMPDGLQVTTDDPKIIGCFETRIRDGFSREEGSYADHRRLPLSKKCGVVEVPVTHFDLEPGSAVTVHESHAEKLRHRVLDWDKAEGKDAKARG